MGHIDEVKHLLDELVSHVAALALAYVLAFPIGWDRERKERSAGLRTFALVSIASCGFVQATEGLLANPPDAQARIIAGLITGIGFIGAGAIIKQGRNVEGTATAAALWATGAIGVAVGLANYGLAIAVTLFTILTFRGLSPLKQDQKPGGGPDEPHR